MWPSDYGLRPHETNQPNTCKLFILGILSQQQKGNTENILVYRLLVQFIELSYQIYDGSECQIYDGGECQIYDGGEFPSLCDTLDDLEKQ